MQEGQAELSEVLLTPVRYDLHADVSVPARIRVNTFFFPGWTLYVDGAEQPLERHPSQGVMEFSLTAGEHRLRLQFEDTSVRIWATGVSLLALLAFLALPWMEKSIFLKRKRRA